VEDLDLIDVGPVVYPAYNTSTTGLRSVTDPEEAKKSYDEWKQHEERLQKLESLLNK
jgi:phage head maturation protease